MKAPPILAVKPSPLTSVLTGWNPTARVTKSLKARIQTEKVTALARENLSEAKLERLALADARYADHMKGIAAAVEERELARHEYWAIKARLDWDNNAIQHTNTLARLER